MKILLIGLFLVLVSFTLYASGDYDSVIYTEDSKPALEGYDTVAYFEDNKPIKGSYEWKTVYKEAEWLFSSENNLNRFLENPDRYSPAYGGYCAWAMSRGDLAPGRPELWDIIDGRLYLNYNKSTRKKFLADIEKMIKDADSKWPEVELELSRAGSE